MASRPLSRFAVPAASIAFANVAGFLLWQSHIQVGPAMILYPLSLLLVPVALLQAVACVVDCRRSGGSLRGEWMGWAALGLYITCAPWVVRVFPWRWIWTG